MHHQKQQQYAVPQEINGPGFSFELPPLSNDDYNNENNEMPFEFAVRPFDPRYYEPSPQQQNAYESIPESEKEEVEIDESNGEPEIEENLSIENPKIGVKGGNNILIPSPMHVNDLLPSSSASSSSISETQSRILHRAQQKQQQMQQQLLSKQASDVLQKPLQVEFDNTTSIYIVALIAGISCAFSTAVRIINNNTFSQIPHLY